MARIILISHRLIKALHSFLNLLEERILTLWETQERKEGREVVFARSLKSNIASAYFNFSQILSDVSLLSFRELPSVLFKPRVLSPTASFKDVFEGTKGILANQTCTACLLGNLLLSFHPDFVCELCGDFPVSTHNRDAICVEVTDFQEMKASIFVLQEVANKVVKASLFPRVNVGL